MRQPSEGPVLREDLAPVQGCRCRRLLRPGRQVLPAPGAVLHQPSDEEGDVLRCQASLRGRQMQVRKDETPCGDGKCCDKDKEVCSSGKCCPEGKTNCGDGRCCGDTDDCCEKMCCDGRGRVCAGGKCCPAGRVLGSGKSSRCCPPGTVVSGPARERFCCPKNDPDCCSDELTCLGDGLVCVRGICQKL